MITLQVSNFKFYLMIKNINTKIFLVYSNDKTFEQHGIKYCKAVFQFETTELYHRSASAVFNMKIDL